MYYFSLVALSCYLYLAYLVKLWVRSLLLFFLSITTHQTPSDHPRNLFVSGMEFNKFRIRSYEGQYDRAQVEDLERRCEVGPSESVFLFTDTMGDPICRIRNSPMYMMLVSDIQYYASHYMASTLSFSSSYYYMYVLQFPQFPQFSLFLFDHHVHH